ncbi:MAG TPA: PorP/SprF family type IX secretion system membrane protein [Bacteroidales bacterium]|nr:PorP/SprF family type IX secretion system membrane protein [Bacteroidales bacterium]
MKFIKIYILILGLSGLLMNLGAQDPQFSQFYSSPLYMGPSFAGSGKGARIITNYRDQWPRISGTFVTYALSADYYIEKYRSGIGLLVLRDDAGKGLMNVTNLGLNYSFNVDLNQKWQFRPGLQVYYYMKNIDYSSLMFGDQILRGGSNTGSSVEMSRLLNAEPTRHVDFTTSMLAYSDYMWFGFTVDHLMYFSRILEKQGDYLPMRLSFYGGGKYNIAGRTRKRYEESITGAFNLMFQDKYKYLDLGAYYTHEPLVFGLWYRGLPVFPDNPNLGAITLLGGFRVKALQLGYSYDFTTSSLITKTGGAHEVSFIYSFAQRRHHHVKHKAVPCPSF